MAEHSSQPDPFALSADTAARLRQEYGAEPGTRAFEDAIRRRDERKTALAQHDHDERVAVSPSGTIAPRATLEVQ